MRPERNRKPGRRSPLSLLGGALLLACCGSPGTASAQVLDSFLETFDNFTSDASIDGIENWSVTEGTSSSAVVQSATTASGSGKALRVSGDTEAVSVQRSATYGGLTPIWVRFLIRPGIGGEERPAPTAGIAALSFDFSGKVLASNGTAWADTGVLYTGGEWWEAIYKLNFTTHTWDLFLRKVNASVQSFTPVKSGLSFIDPAINSLSSFSVGAAYSASQDDDTYIDDLTITYIERLEFTTPAQTLVADQVSKPIIIELQNSLGEAQRAIEDIFIELKTTSAGGTFSLTPEPWREVTQVLLLKDSTSTTVYYRDSTDGRPTLSAKEYPDYGWLEALQQQQIVTSLPHFEITAQTPQTAGVAFPVIIQAKTDDGELYTNYTGTVALSAGYVDPSTGTKTLTPIEAGGFVGGVLELDVAYPDAGVISILAADTEDPDVAGSSGNITLLPASLMVTLADKQAVDRPFTINVTGLNAQGQITPNYAADIALSALPADPARPSAGIIAPPQLSAATFSGGTGSREVVYPSWGLVTIRAVDSAHPQIEGVSAPVLFNPHSVEVLITAPPPPRDFYYIHEPISIKLTPLSFSGKPVNDFKGELSLEAPDALGLPEKLDFREVKVPAALSAAGSMPGTFNLRVKEGGSGWSSETASLEVRSATIKVISSYAPAGGTAEVTIFLLDDKGDVIHAENNAVLDFYFQEDNPNNSLNSSSYSYPVRLINGRATLLLSNAEAEEVLVTPKMPYAMKVEPGKVQFGRYATKSIGVLLWRELDEVRERDDEE